VHGGEFSASVRITPEVRSRIAALAELAPLHNPPGLEALVAAESLLPDVPHVAVFDTAFHATLPPVAYTYALPDEWRREIRRYGFHGLSVRWASERVQVSRLVVCHLGGGCSVTAVRDGKSIDTTMGFTPLEGVPMATRPGSVDPGALLHLLRRGVRLDELDDAIEHRSGLLALSGTSGDVEELELSGDDRAGFALDLFGYRVGTAVGAMSVALGGLDALVFTAGIGENSARMRAGICSHLAFLGVELHPGRNEEGHADSDISADSSSVRVVVVRAREEVVAARDARALLG
jgi:acetate kinase